MGIKIVKTEKKKRCKKQEEGDKMARHRVQYTKIAVTCILFLTIIVTLASLYINLKTQSNMDTIAVEMIQTFWKIFLVYGVKSYLETKQEKKIEGFTQANENL